MTLGINGLVTAYVILAAALAGLNIFSVWSWPLKALLLVVTTAAYLVLYFSFPPLLGWPSATELPKRFQLVALYAQEPDRITGAEGGIFFWVLDKQAGTASVPRAYAADFEPELHARAKEAGQRLRKNVPQVGEVGADDKDLRRHGVPRDEAKLGQKSQKLQVKFFDAPPDAPPSKSGLPEATSDTTAADFMQDGSPGESASPAQPSG
ncbi:MAG: hypothetical protein ACT4NU_06335 [Chromatiales bacterium]